MREKPRYRIKWDRNDKGHVVGYFVFTCNSAAVELKPSFWIGL